PASGSLTNTASVSSPTGDPNPTNNVTPPVVTGVTLLADVGIGKSGPAFSFAGSNFTYTVTVTNSGPSTATNVVVSDQLPAGFAFVSATPSATVSNNLVSWPAISLAKNAVSNFMVTAVSAVGGNFTNIAFATSDTLDPNLTNNNGTSPASQVQTTIALAQFALLISGAPVFNPQTGLFEELVTVTNTGNVTVAGVRLLVDGLRSGVTLYNATGITNGIPYVQYNFPLDPGNTVSFTLEFYDQNRLPFANVLTAIAILPPNSGSPGTNGVVINRIFLDTRIVGDTRIVIEFSTTPGETYTIIYSDNNLTWKVATPSITANAISTQWYDDGPPKTDSKPLSMTSRFYRVIAAP
ncbi:MAG: DUF11 domain-containing protein, partial [Verrucomicrobiota bacterium]